MLPLMVSVNLTQATTLNDSSNHGHLIAIAFLLFWLALCSAAIISTRRAREAIEQKRVKLPQS